MQDVVDMMENYSEPADISQPDCDTFDHIGAAELGMAFHLAETMAEKDEEVFTEEDDEILSILAKEDVESDIEMIDPRSKSESEVEVQPFEAHVMGLCGIRQLSQPDYMA